MKFKLNNLGPILISTGVTLGVAAPTLVSLALLWSDRLKVFNPLYFLTITYVISHGWLVGDVKIAILQATIIYLMLVSTEPKIQIWLNDNILSLIFYFQIFAWFCTGFLFHYVGGFSAAGFQIVNDFSLQLAVIAIVLHRQKKIPLILIPILIGIFYFNDSKLILLVYISFLLWGVCEKNIYIRFYVCIFGLAFIYTEYSNILDLLTYIDYLRDGISCGSICFRVFALFLSIDFLQSNILFGSGPGTLTSHLVELGFSGESYIMAGSIHNIGMELLAENGILLILLLYISLRRKLPYISLPRVFLFFALCSAAGQSIYSIGLIYILFGRFVRKNHA